MCQSALDYTESLKIEDRGDGGSYGIPYTSVYLCVCIYVDTRVLYAGTLQNPTSNDTF